MAAPRGDTCGLLERSVRARVPPLLTDLYQFTMAYAYWRAGRHQEPAVFELFFRDNPFGGGFSLLAGLNDCLLFLRGFRFSADGRGACAFRAEKVLFSFTSIHAGCVNRTATPRKPLEPNFDL